MSEKPMTYSERCRLRREKRDKQQLRRMLLSLPEQKNAHQPSEAVQDVTDARKSHCDVLTDGMSGTETSWNESGSTDEQQDN